MTEKRMVRDENKLLTLEEDFYGSIYCKKLMIPQGIKCVGHVVAEEIQVKGEFDGYAQASVFYAFNTSKLDGVIFADEVHNNSRDQGARIDSRLYKMVAPLFTTEAQINALIETAVEAALAQAALAVDHTVAPPQPSVDSFEDFGGADVSDEISAALKPAAETIKEEQVETPTLIKIAEPSRVKSPEASAAAAPSLAQSVATPRNSLMRPLF